MPEDPAPLTIPGRGRPPWVATIVVDGDNVARRWPDGDPGPPPPGLVIGLTDDARTVATNDFSPFVEIFKSVTFAQGETVVRNLLEEAGMCPAEIMAARSR